jgi:hypothetical protein
MAAMQIRCAFLSFFRLFEINIELMKLVQTADTSINERQVTK